MISFTKIKLKSLLNRMREENTASLLQNCLTEEWLRRMILFPMQSFLLPRLRYPFSA